MRDDRNPEDNKRQDFKSSDNSQLPGELADILAAQPHTEQKESAKQRLDVEFIYAQHTEEFFEQIADALKDKDVLFLELESSQVSQEEHDVYLKALRMIFNAAPDNAAADELAKNLRENELEGDGPTTDYLALVTKLRGKGKEINFIDVTPGDEQARELDEASNGAYEKLVTVWEEFSSPDVVIDAYKEWIIKRAAFSKYREKLVVQQLQEAFIKLQERRPNAKIGVFQGAAHTSTFIDIKSNKDVKAKRNFIVPRSHPNAKVKDLRGYYEELNQDAVKLGAKNLDSNKLSKGVIELYLTGLMRGVWRDRHFEMRQILDNLGDDQTKEILQTIHTLGTTQEGDGWRLVGSYLAELVESRLYPAESREVVDVVGQKEKRKLSNLFRRRPR